LSCRWIRSRLESNEAPCLLAHPGLPDERHRRAAALVDRLAGALAFHRAIFAPALRDATAGAGWLTFEAAEAVRTAVAPEASRQSVILACVRQCTEPVYFLRCRLEYKQAELRRLTSAQLDLFPGERRVPERQLRVVEAAGSPSAAEKGFRVHQKMRVPESSVVAHAFRDGLIMSESGRERLERWETSSGGPIGEGWIDVDARCFDDEVWALLRFRGAGGRLVPPRTPSSRMSRARP
jgi:hypothetical protein